MIVVDIDAAVTFMTFLIIINMFIVIVVAMFVVLSIPQSRCLVFLFFSFLFFFQSFSL